MRKLMRCNICIKDMLHIFYFAEFMNFFREKKTTRYKNY